MGPAGGVILALGVGAAIALSCPTAGAAPAEPGPGVQGAETQRSQATRRSAVERRPAAQSRPAAERPAAPARARGTASSAPAARPVAALLFNKTPTLSPTKTGQSPTGVVSGMLNANDPDSAPLRYAVVAAPAHGTVSVDDAGLYTYTPDPALAVAGYTDSFAVSVSDAESGLHLHGLGGLINLLTFGMIGASGHTTRTTVPVVVDAIGPAGYPPSVERQIYATVTDSAITATPNTGEAPHVVINPSPLVTPREELVVFLPGTQGRPSQYTYILRTAADLGFHAVGLSYPNQTAMGSLCRNSSDTDCYWTARNEVLFGDRAPVSGQSDVAPADSIVNRVGKLLVWMDEQYPDEDWGQFLLVDDTVDWSKVVLAGHSQGGGHVGVMAKTVTLGRAVYFSSPDDWNALTDAPADWTLTKPNVTPADRQYGFGSDADTLVPNAHAFAHWDNLGLPETASGPVLVDDIAAPFAGSHQLYTSLPYNPASTALTATLKNHGITVVDTSTPLDSVGTPLFAANGVWAYLLAPLGSGGANVT